jgi:hypothetical protein
MVQKPITIAAGVSIELTPATTSTGATAGQLLALNTNTLIDATLMTPLGASGSAHSAGIAPDPGATAGTTRFLREDGTWVKPSTAATGTGFLYRYAQTAIQTGDTVTAWNGGTSKTFASAGSIPASTLVVGSVIHVRAQGYFTATTSTSPAIGLNVLIAGTSYVSNQGLYGASSPGTFYFEIEFYATVRTTGANGTLNSGAVIRINTNSYGATSVEALANTGTQVIGTTVANSVAVSINGAASSADTAIMQQLLVTVL